MPGKPKEIRPPKLRKQPDKGMLSGFERARGVLGEHYDNYLLVAELPDGTFEYCGHRRVWSEGAARKFLRKLRIEDEERGLDA